MKSGLTMEETRAMFQQVAQQIIACQDQLSDADRAIGDGDHGVGMARGFESVLEALEETPSVDMKGLFQKVGMALITSMGGASGVIFGTWFTGGSKALVGRTVLDRDAFQAFMEQGVKAVQERGKAKAGDKTMLDALIPAWVAAGEANQSLPEVLGRAAEAAAQGVESTKHMVATVGRAKALGERSIGFADPGAISTHLILESMAQYAKAIYSAEP
jgi:phosphoenolpyruvate---glycerone phosphotransferase subunit DhaL